MQPENIRNISIDWVTATSNRDEHGTVWWEHYVNYRRRAMEEGDEERSYNNGFYAGVRIGHMQWGYSDHLGYILICSSEEAERQWSIMMPAKHRITRLDLCVDLEYPEPIMLARINHRKRESLPSTKIPVYSLWENSRGGSTFYVGSRQSQQFGRLYDKGIESGRRDQGLMWRAEVEIKKPLSGKIAQELADMPTLKRKEAILQFVLGWFNKRFVELGVKSEESIPMVLATSKRITTNEKRLTWLRSQVAPTIHRLMDAGMGTEALGALGISYEDLRDIFGTKILPE